MLAVTFRSTERLDGTIAVHNVSLPTVCGHPEAWSWVPALHLGRRLADREMAMAWESCSAPALSVEEGPTTRMPFSVGRHSKK